MLNVILRVTKKWYLSAADWATCKQNWCNDKVYHENNDLSIINWQMCLLVYTCLANKIIATSGQNYYIHITPN